jgi:cytochrome P450
VEAAESGVAWLRTSVSRFTNGADHAQRREHVETMLGTLDPAALRAEAAAQTGIVLDDAAGSTLDVMSALARRVPIAVLAEALRIGRATAQLVTAVTHAAAAYPPGADREREQRADKAVEQLVVQLGGRNATAVSRLTLLVQACDATAGLIGNSLNIALHLSQRPGNTEGLLAETLRYDPPVRNSRRVASVDSRVGEATIEQGGTVVLDFAAANRDPDAFAEPHRFQPGREERHLTFGHGFRACPGTDHALAIAAGIVEPVLARCEAVSPDVDYEPSPNLRVPAVLEVTVR